MSRTEYTPNERVIDRVVSLWIDALRAPKYDNGDTTGVSAVAAALAARISKNNDEETLSRFGVELKARLMQPFTHRPWREGGEPRTEWVTSLRVDYDPDEVLGDAAYAAGLKMQFPWKTTMYFDDGHVCFVQGYAAGTVYHYPAEGGAWVVTSLHGSQKDVRALVEFAQGGGRAEFFRYEENQA